MVLALIAGKLARKPQNTQPAPAVTQPSGTDNTDNKKGKILPTVEMGNSIGIVQSLTVDSLTIKTEEGKTLKLTVNGKFNVFTFVDKDGNKSVEQKNMSDIKTGSKVSVQYSKENEVLSMYLLK